MEYTITAEEAEKTEVDSLFGKLESSESGLSTSDAEQRLSQFGHNEISEKKMSPFMKFLSYFWEPIPWMIEVAAVLSLLLRHWVDFTIIVVLLIFNAVVGFWQEYQAGNAVEALKKKLALKSRVLRDGTWQEIDAQQGILSQKTISCPHHDLVGHWHQALGHRSGCLWLRPYYADWLGRHRIDLGLFHHLGLFYRLGQGNGLSPLWHGDSTPSSVS